MQKAAIIGAGPAGLTAAYILAKQGFSVTVLEQDPQYVGGLSRTIQHNGFHFDIGGHRFFSKAKEVQDFWTEILPDDLLERRRSSRIFYDGEFYSYPLRPLEALVKLGPWEAARCAISYLKAAAFPRRPTKSFEDWVVNEFGDRLYRIFFKTYTEKVWGMDCSEISADWAAQRIKGVSLISALKPQRRPKLAKSLIRSFWYPRKGPGMMWEACAAKTRDAGGTILMDQSVVGCAYDDGERVWTVSCKTPEGTETIKAEHVVSSAPIRELIRGLHPKPPQRVLKAANALRYRDFLTVVLIMKDANLFSDNWIYVHDPSVKVGRIQNYKSWSPEMVPDPSYSCYGLEYFCFEGDGLWNASDEELIELGTRELKQIGLIADTKVAEGYVIRQHKAYPVYDDAYAENVAIIRDELERNYPGLHLVGRNGMHKYNNQDHAIMTAMLTAQNIIHDRRVYDVWQVNQDAEYTEAGFSGVESVTGLRAVPTRVTS